MMSSLALPKMTPTFRAQRTCQAFGIAPEFERRWRFAAVELFRFDGRARHWRLRNGSGTVVLRSGSSDIEIFEEIYASKIYDPPADVAAALSRRPVRLIADLGANVGLFAVRALDRFREAKVVSFEPDRENLAVIRACRAASPFCGRWRIEGVAAGVRWGTVPFLGGRQATSRWAEGPEARGPEVCEVPIVDCFEVLTRADMIKIDIEGAEWPILEDARFAGLTARVIALEYHAEHSDAPCPREGASDLLREAGYRVRACSKSVHCGQLWGWRA
jgi:FkbM family methyltransferase